MTTFRAFDWTRAQKDFFMIFDDFFKYDVLDWTLTTVEAGASSATEAVGNLAGGVLVVTNDTADNDVDTFQWAGNNGATKETFKFTPGKKLQFVTRFKLSRVDGDFFAGLCITDTDLEGGMTDGIYFRKLAAEAGLKIVSEKNSGETSAVVITTLVADTWYDIEFYYDGGSTVGGHDRIKVYVNGYGSGAISLAAVDSAPDDEELALTFAMQNGSANASILSIDFIGARQER